MRYYFMLGNGQRIYDKSLSIIRARVFRYIAITPGNMGCNIPIFSEDGRIAEWNYLKEMKDGRVYWCFCNCRTLQTFRTYYDLEDRRIKDCPEIPWIEIFTMRGKQLIAKDVYA